MSANQDLTDVARQDVEDSIKASADDTKKNAEHAIQQTGREQLRGVQSLNNQAIDAAGSSLEANADANLDRILSDVRATSSEGQQQLESESMEARAHMAEHLDAKSRKTMAFYIHVAKRELSDLKAEMEKSGTEMTQEMKNTIAVSTNAERVIDKLATDAEMRANYSKTLWSNTQKEVTQARVAANKTEDAVRISSMGTKLSSQAVEHAMHESRTAYDMATQANLTGNMIIKKVFKTKAGIEDVTREVLDALSKASKANVDAHQADMVATKLALKLQ